ANGQFFGPAMQEVGGVFTASGTGGAKGAGAFYGVKDPSAGDPLAPVAGLAQLDRDTDLRLFSHTELRSISYDATSDGYILSLRIPDTVRLDTTTLNSALSDSTRQVYEGALDGNPTFRATIPNLSSQVALTHTMLVDVIRFANNPAYPNLADYAVGV